MMHIARSADMDVVSTRATPTRHVRAAPADSHSVTERIPCASAWRCTISRSSRSGTMRIVGWRWRAARSEQEPGRAPSNRRVRRTAHTASSRGHRRRRRRRARAGHAPRRQARPARTAEITLIDQARAPVEAAAARGRRRQHGPGRQRDRLPGAGLLARLHLSRRRDDRARPAAPELVHVGPFVDEEGRQVTAAQEIGYDTLVIAVGSLTNDFGTPGVKAHAIALETADEAARFHRRLVNACIRAHIQKEPLATRSAAGRHHRRGRHRGRACGRAAQDDAPARRLRPRPHRSRHGHQAPPDRGRAAHPAAAARAPVARRRASCWPASR